MAVISSQVPVTTTATLLVADSLTSEEVRIHATGGIYIGDASVTTTTGFRLDAGDKLTLSTHVGALYGIAATGSHVTYVLVIDK